MIVVDVNTVAYLWIPGELTALAEQVLARDPHWVSSVLWRSEFRNILAGYFRQGSLRRSISHKQLLFPRGNAERDFVTIKSGTGKCTRTDSPSLESQRPVRREDRLAVPVQSKGASATQTAGTLIQLDV